MIVKVDIPQQELEFLAGFMVSYNSGEVPEIPADLSELSTQVLNGLTSDQFAIWRYVMGNFVPYPYAGDIIDEDSRKPFPTYRKPDGSVTETIGTLMVKPTAENQGWQRISGMVEEDLVAPDGVYKVPGRLISK